MYIRRFPEKKIPPCTAQGGIFFPENRLKARQCGISLIELVMFIVIVSVGVVGILAVMNVTTRHSADPLIRKQVVAVAESLLEEVALHPFTYCDPNDVNVLNATTSANCTGGAGGPNDQSVQFAVGETRYSSSTPFDNVSDYSGFSMPGGIKPINDPVTSASGLENYTAAVTITQAGGAGKEFPTLLAAAVLRIDVVVTSGAEIARLSGYRFRYAPNSTP